MSFMDDVNHYADFISRNQRREMTETDVEIAFAILQELKMDGRLLPQGGVSEVEYGLHDTKMTRRDFPVFIGTTEWAKQHATHRRRRTVWISEEPNDRWAKYVTGWEPV